MSYKITYQSVQENDNRINRRRLRVLLMSVACFMLFLLLVKGFWKTGNGVLSTVVLGNRAEILEKSVRCVWSSVCEGQSFSEAVKTVCQEMLNEANIRR